MPTPRHAARTFRCPIVCMMYSSVCVCPALGYRRGLCSSVDPEVPHRLDGKVQSGLSRPQPLAFDSSQTFDLR